jgi:DnaD/phage-associated family protein
MSDFSMDEQNNIPIPENFFTTVLPKLDSLEEARVTLYAFWYFAHLSDDPRFLSEEELLADEKLGELLGGDPATREQRLKDSLLEACEHGALLAGENAGRMYYFPNTARGKAARDGLMAGKWQPDENAKVKIQFAPQRPNIFTLYEQNIGVLTPMIAENLQAAEQEYPAEWIEEAIRIAVTKNARNWRFVEAVLRTWKEKGRYETDRGSAKEDRKRDSEGKFSDYVNR